MTWDEVCRLTLALPGTEVSTSYGSPALKVRGKLIAWLRDGGDTLVVKVDFEERLALTHSDPETFFVTDHYLNYPMVLVRLARVDPEELRELLIEAWLLTAPRKLVMEYEASL
ncbi:MAG: MmcQ/YjbR family DNA-binding protein [Gaiellaceae bacterium]